VSKKGKQATSKKAAEARQIKKQLQNQPSKKKIFLKALSHTWLLFSLFAGLVGFLFLVWPRISIYSGESLDPYRPFETPFIIKNDGNLPLLDINYVVTIDKMEDIRHNQFSNVSAGGFTDRIPKLNANKSSAIFVNRVVNAPPNYIKYAEVYIEVTYKSYMFPYTFRENIRFKTEMKSTGEYIWLEYFSEK
jgi:hypothetical protein